MIGTADDGVSHGRVAFLCMVSCHVHDIMSCARNHVVGSMTCPVYEVMPSVAAKRR